MQSAGLPPEGWEGWPESREFSFVLTHDVESEGGLKKVRALAELEMELGFRSSFNLIPEGPYDVPDELREWLKCNGFEVGVHDLHHDGRLYASRRKFQRRARRINDYVRKWKTTGFRSGFMLRNLEWIGELDIVYDASTFDTDPFEPQPDGVGTIFPFWVESPRGGGYVELPYTLAQDTTLFLVLEESSDRLWREKLHWIVESGGMALVNVHPDFLAFGEQGGKHDLVPISRYADFLRHVKETYAGRYWSALPAEVALWFRESRCGRMMRNVPAASCDMGNTPETGIEPSAGIREGGETVAGQDCVLTGRRAAVVVLSDYVNDPRPRRAAEALAHQGMKVDVICSKRDGGAPSRTRLNGVDVLRLPITHQRGGKLNYLMEYFFFVTVSGAILSFRTLFRRYSLVHIHNMPDILVFSSLVPRIMGAKVILDLHDPMPELMRTIYGMEEESGAVKLLKFLEKLSIGFAHAAITVNRTCKEILAGRSCSPEKVTVIMNSPDEEIFSLRPAESRTDKPEGDRFVVMYHGSLVERNGLGLAVDAIKQVSERLPGVQLHIYGHCSEFLEQVLARAEAAGLSECVHFMGSKRIEDIVDAIDACDLGIVPNLRNIFTELNTPTRILEFLARGKPVVAPSAPGVLEYFSEEELVMFELGDAGSLAERIEFAVRNRDTVLEMTRRGQTVAAAHRWSEERESLVGLVRELLGAGPSGRTIASPHQTA
jgi:glycosyltransferase involved in cell wall biosynthesis